MYQRENHEVTLRLFQIINFDVFKINDMFVNKLLKRFQSIVVKVLINFENNLRLKNCVLINATSFEKFIVILKYLFHVNELLFVTFIYY